MCNNNRVDGIFLCVMIFFFKFLRWKHVDSSPYVTPCMRVYLINLCTYKFRIYRFFYTLHGPTHLHKNKQSFFFRKSASRFVATYAQYDLKQKLNSLYCTYSAVWKTNKKKKHGTMVCGRNDGGFWMFRFVFQRVKIVLSNSDSWRTRKIVETLKRGAPSVFSLSATNFHEATINSLMHTRVLWIPRECRDCEIFGGRGGGGGKRERERDEGGNYYSLSYRRKPRRAPSKLTGRKFFDMYIPIFFIIHGIVYS